MRQFGLDQPIPGRSHQPDHLHSVTLSGRTEDIWLVIHADYIHRWDTCRDRIQQGPPLVAQLTSTSEYMKWYRCITRRWIGRSSATLGRVISQSTPPSQTLVQPPGDEVEQGGSRARRRRTSLAATRTRLRDDEPSSSSSHGTQSSTLAPTVPPLHPPQQHFAQHPYQYLGYIVYPIPPHHTRAVGSSASSTAVPPFPLNFPYPYPISVSTTTTTTILMLIF
ncbi:hypothetical protein PIB30_078502 [Stylosanthes scabra]|uniref:Serine/threonine-protein phosphatase 7 long form-like n=1 Tax=Stylosanthes scabra TaxID=79078 RepID=A0ABU6VST8_9FABA|nr:hypothetical protein [Stylosanthes scabra]